MIKTLINIYIKGFLAMKKKNDVLKHPKIKSYKIRRQIGNILDVAEQTGSLDGFVLYCLGKEGGTYTRATKLRNVGLTKKDAAIFIAEDLGELDIELL